MTLGLKFLSESTLRDTALINFFGKSRDNGAIILITAGLIVGYFKGKFILSKAAKREVNRVSALPNPTTFKHFYSKKYYILLSCMIALGMLMRFLSIPLDIRGFIDVAIGGALINGSRFYFKNLLKPKTTYVQ